jgi:hypothetical protein
MYRWIRAIKKFCDFGSKLLSMRQWCNGCPDNKASCLQELIIIIINNTTTTTTSSSSHKPQH